MTIRNKIVLSNILMILIPVLFAVIFAVIAFSTYGDRYWDSMEEMYDDDNSVYAGQSIIYGYKEQMSKNSWQKNLPVGEDGTRFQETRTRKMRRMERELSIMGYHMRIYINEEEVYSNMTMEEEDRIGGYFERSYDKIGSLALSDDKGSIIKNTFKIQGYNCEIAAVRLEDTKQGIPQRFYVKKYIFLFAIFFILFIFIVIILTNIVLSRWVAHIIFNPLDILKNGTKEIAEGNLDFQMDYHNSDEFGDVCMEFEEMREQLKESVDTRLKYEQYRRELISGISHDLRTPLTSIKGYVEGLKDGIANTEEKRLRYYNAIHIRALDMEALVDSLSTFAKLENKEYKYQMEKVDMNEYLQQLIEEYQEEAKQKNALLILDNRAFHTMVMTDIQEMHRVFINLFENSIKYRIKERSVIRISLENRERTLEIRVADDGPGVPERELAHIFTSFYRGDESRTGAGGGSGLGLSITKQIVEAHQGAIRAYNEKGLVVLITLPLKLN